jgi:hypothetical protein
MEHFREIRHHRFRFLVLGDQLVMITLNGVRVLS